MKRIRYVQVFCILVLALVVGTFLPSYISRVQEENLVDLAVTERAQTVRIDRNEKMKNRSLLEKFRFLLNEDVEYIEYVPISDGKNLDYMEALDYLYKDVTELQGMGLVGELGGMEASYKMADDGIHTEGKLYTAANTKNPAQSLIVWKFELLGACSEIYRFTLDDATGKLIGIEVYTPIVPLKQFQPIHFEDVATCWGKYIEADDMAVNDIMYRTVDRKAIADRMLKESSLARWSAAAYGYSAEEEGNVAFDDGNKDVLTREPFFDSEGILLDFVYQEPEDQEVHCVLEWDDCGYRFRIPKDIKEKKR